MRKTILFVTTIALLLLAAFSARAMRVYVANETYVDEAQHIVVGTMVNVDKDAGTGAIKVEKNLVGDPERDRIKVRFQKKFRGIRMADGGLSYDQGQKGAWLLLLTMNGEDDRYNVANHACYYRPEDLQKLTDTIDRLEELPWSKPVDGLAARALVHQRGPGSTRLIYLAVKNTTKKVRRINNYRGHRLVKVLIEEPDGDERELDLYANLQNARLQEPRRKDFPRLAPGEKRYVGFRYGINSGKLENPGEYLFTVTYVNRHDGSDAGLDEDDNVWTGKITVPPVKIQVK